MVCECARCVRVRAPVLEERWCVCARDVREMCASACGSARPV